MKKIVVSSNYNNLRELLKDDDGVYSYIMPGRIFSEIEGFLKEKKYKKVETVKGLNGIDFKKEYIDFVGRLNRNYNSRYWWASSISYKGTFVSDLAKEIYNYYSIISLIKRADSNYIIVSDNSVLNSSIERFCKEGNVECALLDEEKREGAIVHFRRCLLSSIYFLCDGWLRKIWISFYLSRRIKGSIVKNKSYYVIRSWINSRSFSDSNEYKDLYFGRLPQYLKDKDKNPVILAGILTDYRAILKKLKHAKEPVMPQEYFAGYLDYLKVAMLALINRPKIKKGVTFCGIDVSDLLNKCLKKDYEHNEIGKNLMYYFYARRIAENFKIDVFMFTFENQAWEKMTSLALKKYSPDTKILGYVHSSIRESLLNYFNSKEEEGIIPLPHRIMTVGKGPKEILEAAGNYAGNTELTDACALRYENIFKNHRAKQYKDGNIVVTFSIDPIYSLKLLLFALDAFPRSYRRKVILRSHPFTPVEVIAKDHGVQLGKDFQISKNLEFEQDLKDASLVLYVDTTSSMEALMRGVPAIHINFKEPVSPDPLFKLNSFKWTVSSKEELHTAIDYIYSMGNEEYTERYSEAVSYIKRYFHPVEDRYLERFLA
ncbi:hypothetical protein ACFL2G_01925 [Candidatus Omnitrophota bacterium]